MSSASTVKTSQAWIEDYVRTNHPKFTKAQVTETCHQHCIQAFEQIKTAMQETEKTSCKNKAVIVVANTDLIGAIQMMFFEKYALKIELNLDKESSHYELTLNELDFKLSQLSLQDKTLLYKRPPMSDVTKESVNPPVKLDKPPERIQLYAKGATCYSWNAEGVRDHGWGCAWRAIQTCLSSYGITVSFKDLFHKFGSFEMLKTIYQTKYPLEVLSSAKKFAPHDTAQGWAEPFIGEMVLVACGKTADLERLNGIPKDCNAPHEVFHRPSLTINEFTKRLENHFKSEKHTPIMIDDGNYSYNIVGIGLQESQLSLWIADPHIKEGVNRDTPMGLYTITLDKDGKQIRCSLSHEDQHQKNKMNSAGSYTALNFSDKPWMILFPK